MEVPVAEEVVEKKVEKYSGYLVKGSRQCEVPYHFNSIQFNLIHSLKASS